MHRNNKKSDQEFLKDWFINLKETGIDKKLSNVEFWSDRAKIESYCYSILQYFNVKKQVAVVFDGNGAFVVNEPKGDKYVITVPRMLPGNEENIIKQIYIRASLLRHELSHMIFTDNNIRAKILNEQQIKGVFAYLEDARIENLYAKTLKGTKVAFAQVLEIFFERYIDDIINKQINANSFYNFFQFRAKEVYKIDINVNKVIKKYEELFNEYKWILNSTDCEKVYNAYKEIDEKIKKLEEKEKSNSNKKKQNKKNKQQDECNENCEKEDSNSQNKELENNDNINDSTVEINDENKQESENINEISDENKQELDTNEENKKDNKSSSSTSDKKSEKSEDENKSKSESEKSESEDENEDESNNDKPNYNDLLRETLKIYSNEVTNELYENRIINNLSYQSALEVDFIALSNLIGGHGALSKREGYRFYGNVVSQNKAVITEIIKFLAIKLQHKNRTKDLFYQEEGNIDQSNLKEIIIVKDRPRAFLKQIKSISPTSRISMLIDISASMNHTQIEMCIVNSIILVEVCKRLNLKYEISFFTNIEDSWIHVTKNKNEKDIIKVFKEYKQYVNIDRNNGTLRFYVNYPNKSANFIFKRCETEHRKIFECYLGNLYKKPERTRTKLAGHSTPEFSAMVALYKRHYKSNNNIIFIFNDGSFDREKQMCVENKNFSWGSDADSAHFYCKNKEEYINAAVNHLSNGIMLCANVTKSILENPEKNEIIENISSAIAEDEIKKVISLFDDLVNDAAEIYQNVAEFVKEKQFLNFGSKTITGKKGICYAVISTEKNNNNDTFNLSINYNFSSQSHYYSQQGSEDYFRYRVYRLISNEIRNAILNEEDLTYKYFINNMRKVGFRVMGIGINSEYGKRYIGNEYFDYVHNPKDIRDNFAKKLKNIF